MNVLIINGSPKKNKSNTMRITNAFLRGLKSETKINVSIINSIDADVKPCRGCYSCWTSSPGKCVIKDEMEKVLDLYITSDIVIWSFPNYHFGMPSTAKAILDRLLPIYLPLIDKRNNGGALHPGRYDLHRQKYVLISTCGFYSYENNTEALEKQFEILYGEKCTEIICLEGDLFNYRALNFRTKEYLKNAREAGKEFAKNGYVSDKTKEMLRNIHYNSETFVKLANNSWDNTVGLSNVEKNNIKVEKLINVMCYIYLPEYINVDNVVLEMYFYDYEITCQIIFNKCEALAIFDKSQFQEYNLRIESKFSTWERILQDGTKVAMESNVLELCEYKNFLHWLSKIKKSGKRKVLSI